MEEHEGGTSADEVGAWVEQTFQAPSFLVGSLLTPIGSSRAFFECLSHLVGSWETVAD